MITQQTFVRRWLNFTVPKLIRYNPYLGFIFRKIFPLMPFLLPHERAYFGLKHLATGKEGLFLDIGANDGISVLGFRQINPHYRIFSIEPNPYHERKLARLKNKLPYFDYIMAGAGAKKGEMTLYIPLYKKVPLHTAASFRFDFLTSVLERQFLAPYRNRLHCIEQKVPVITIDELSLDPTVMKIDTEGFDYNVLLGSMETIRRVRPYILMEYHPDIVDKIENMFSREKYELFFYDFSADRFMPFDKLREFRYYQNLRMTNIFCIPSERAGRIPV